jgi:DNA-binding transcriptional MerR regulator
MSQADMLSINAVAAKLGLSVHQLRRWELMFGLEIKRGRGQQRQYRSEDMSVLERIKELVEQGWPTSQIRPQLEAEGLVTPKLIGMPPPPGNPEVLSEALIGFRNFTERRFIEISKQIDELRQLLISITLKQELSGEPSSPWQPVQREFAPEPKAAPPQEISIGPDFSAGPPVEFTPPAPPPQRTSIIGAPPPPKESTFEVGPSAGSFSTPPSFTPAPPERRSIIGEPTATPASPMTPQAPVMSEEEADALLEDEDLNEEGLSEDEVIAAAQPPAPAEVKDALLDENIDEEDLDEDEDLDEEEEEAQPSPSAPTITPVTSSSAFSFGGQSSPTTSGSFSPAGGEAPMPAPTLPSPPPDPFKSSPFLSSAPPAPEPPAPAVAPSPPQPAISEPLPAPTPPQPASSFAPSSPALTPASAGDMFSSVIQSVNDAAARESLLEPPPKPPDDVPFFTSSSEAPPPPVPSPAVPGPGGTPFTPPSAESSPFIPTPPSSSSSPFLTPPPAPYLSGGTPQPPAQPFEPSAPPQPFEPSAPPQPEPAPPAPPAPQAPPAQPTPPAAPPEAPKAAPSPAQKGPFLGEITDQNYLTILGRALDLVGWSDEQADGFSVSRFKVPHWDELGRSQAEVLIEHLLSELQAQMSSGS